MGKTVFLKLVYLFQFFLIESVTPPYSHHNLSSLLNVLKKSQLGPLDDLSEARQNVLFF